MRSQGASENKIVHANMCVTTGWYAALFRNNYANWTERRIFFELGILGSHFRAHCLWSYLPKCEQSEIILPTYVGACTRASESLPPPHSKYPRCDGHALNRIEMLAIAEIWIARLVDAHSRIFEEGGIRRGSRSQAWASRKTSLGTYRAGRRT